MSICIGIHDHPCDGCYVPKACENQPGSRLHKQPLWLQYCAKALSRLQKKSSPSFGSTLAQYCSQLCCPFCPESQSGLNP